MGGNAHSYTLSGAQQPQGIPISQTGGSRVQTGQQGYGGIVQQVSGGYRQESYGGQGGFQGQSAGSPDNYGYGYSNGVSYGSGVDKLKDLGNTATVGQYTPVYQPVGNMVSQGSSYSPVVGANSFPVSPSNVNFVRSGSSAQPFTQPGQSFTTQPQPIYSQPAQTIGTSVVQPGANKWI